MTAKKFPDWLDELMGPPRLKRGTDLVEVPKRAILRIEGADEDTLFDDPVNGETVLDLTALLGGGGGVSSTGLAQGAVLAGQYLCTAGALGDATALRAATAANRATAGHVVGIALADALDGATVTYAPVGHVVQISGFSAPVSGAPTRVIINAAAYAELSDAPGPGDYVGGVAEGQHGHITIDPQPPRIIEVNPLDPRWGAKDDPTFDSSDALQNIVNTLGPAGGLVIKHAANTPLYLTKPVRIPYSNVSYEGAGKTAESVLTDLNPGGGFRYSFPFFVIGPAVTPPLGAALSSRTAEGPSWDLSAAGDAGYGLVFGKCGTINLRYNETNNYFASGFCIEFPWHVGTLGAAFQRESIFGSAGRYTLDEVPHSAVWIQQAAVNGTDARIIANVKIAASPTAKHWKLFELQGGTLHAGDEKMIALTYDHTTLRLYINGLLVASQAAPGYLYQKPYEEWFIGARPSMPGGYQQFTDSAFARGRLGRVRFSSNVRYNAGSYTVPATLTADGFTILLMRFDEIWQGDIFAFDTNGPGGSRKAYVPVTTAGFDNVTTITNSGISGVHIVSEVDGTGGVYMQQTIQGGHVRDCVIEARDYAVFMNNNCFLCAIDNVAWSTTSQAQFGIGLIGACHSTPVTNCNGIRGASIGILAVVSGSVRVAHTFINGYQTLAFAGVDSDCHLMAVDADTEDVGPTQDGGIAFSLCSRVLVEGGSISAGAAVNLTSPVIVDAGGTHAFNGVLWNHAPDTPAIVHVRRAPAAISINDPYLPYPVPLCDSLQLVTSASGGLTVAGTLSLVRQFRAVPPLDPDTATFADVVTWILRTQAEAQGAKLMASDFNPATSITGLKAWFKADTSVTQSGGLVSQWTTAGGPSVTLAQATGANKPTYSATGGIIGGPYLESTDGLRYLQTIGIDLFTASEERVICWVGRLRDPGTRPDDLERGGAIVACGLSNRAVMMGASQVANNGSAYDGAPTCWVSGRGITATEPYTQHQQYVGVVGSDVNIGTNDDPHVFLVHFKPGGLSTLRIDGQYVAGSPGGDDGESQTGSAGWSLFGSSILLADSALGYVGTLEEFFAIDHTGTSVPDNIPALETYLLQKYALGPWAGADAMPSGTGATGQWDEGARDAGISTALGGSFTAITPSAVADNAVLIRRDATPGSNGTYAFGIERQQGNTPTTPTLFTGQGASTGASGGNEIGGDTGFFSGTGKTSDKDGVASVGTPNGARLDFHPTGDGEKDVDVVKSPRVRWQGQNVGNGGAVHDQQVTASTNSTTADQTIATIPIYGNGADLFVDVVGVSDGNTANVKTGRASVGILVKRDNSGNLVEDGGTTNGVVFDPRGEVMDLKAVVSSSSVLLKVTPWAVVVGPTTWTITPQYRTAF